MIRWTSQAGFAGALRAAFSEKPNNPLDKEMLRPEDWLIEQMTLVVEPIPVMLSGHDDLLLSVESPSGSNSPIKITSDTEFNQATMDQNSLDFSPTSVPLRPIYSHLAELLIEATANRNQVLGMVVELDLPELGIRGPAWIVDLEPAPLVPAGPGQVVTATFKQASANVLDLVLTNAPPTTLSNPPTALSTQPTNLPALNTSPTAISQSHSTLSPPPAELQTLSGDIHWVQQNLACPGPEPVYNLEVYAEHVYSVGTNGMLALLNFGRRGATTCRCDFDVGLLEATAR